MTFVRPPLVTPSTCIDGQVVENARRKSVEGPFPTLLAKWFLGIDAVWVGLMWARIESWTTGCRHLHVSPGLHSRPSSCRFDQVRYSCSYDYRVTLNAEPPIPGLLHVIRVRQNIRRVPSHVSCHPRFPRERVLCLWILTSPRLDIPRPEASKPQQISREYSVSIRDPSPFATPHMTASELPPGEWGHSRSI